MLSIACIPRRLRLACLSLSVALHIVIIGGTAGCQSILGLEVPNPADRCGNGVVDANEVCDDGNRDDGDGCSANCLFTEICGDGIVDNSVAEQCDTGGETAFCDSDCTFPRCGDATVNRAAGEQCDDGNEDNRDFCTAACRLAACEDGLQNGDETEVDCGGACGATCFARQACLSNGDCASQNCVDNQCQVARQIVAGERHTCVLMETGAVRCWGAGFDGQLGYGDTETIGDNEFPVTAGDVDVGGTVAQLATFGDHTCALLESGGVRCWGTGESDEDKFEFDGRLGYPLIIQLLRPVHVDVDIGGPAVQVATGRRHTCALLSTGALRCWGKGRDGRLGYGNERDIGFDEAPASAGNIDVGGVVTQVATGACHTCALIQGGDVRCWGTNDDDGGWLGVGHSDPIGDDETPAMAGAIDVGGTVVQIAASQRHTCALLDTGNVRCWGFSSSGKLGYPNLGHIGDDETPASAGDVDVGGVVVQIAAGRGHTCALLDNGAVRCWGSGSQGRLGYGNTLNIGDDETPAAAGDVPYR